MNFIRRLSTNLPTFGSTFGIHQHAEVGPEMTEGARSIQRLAMKIIDSPFLEQKVEAMIQIGHVAYVGGKEPTQAAVKWLPYIVDMIRNPKYSHNHYVQVAALQTLCEVCHEDKHAKEFVLFNREHVTLLKKLIGNTETSKDVRVGRWACYLLVMVIAGSVELMMEINKDEGLRLALDIAADYNQQSWAGWGVNMADLALKLLGHRDAGRPLDIMHT